MKRIWPNRGGKPECLLTPHILGCVRAYATLGEIIGILRETWGEYVEQNIILLQAREV